MTANIDDGQKVELVAKLSPLAEQASRILSYFAKFQGSIVNSDIELSARIKLVSAQHIAIVKRVLLEHGIARKVGETIQIVSGEDELRGLSQNFAGIATYLKVHKDRDSVRLVITEPGTKSALRQEIDRRHALPPFLFQTGDAFINLARTATRELTVLTPFVDDYGAEFLVTIFSLCAVQVRRNLICRPLTEEHCGPALYRRKADLLRLSVSLFEYALPSQVLSGRETFHAKVILADDCDYYVGSSNLMGSALERSLECGVMIRGETARDLYELLAVLKAISKPFSGWRQ